MYNYMYKKVYVICLFYTTNKNIMEYSDFTCLACGKKIPTVIRTERRGNIECGDYDVKVEYYDTSKNNYFARLDNSEILGNKYKSFTEILIESEKERLRNEINENVSKKEYRKLLENQLFKDVDEKFKSHTNDFNNFLTWLSKPFETGWLPQPSYAIDFNCSKPVLESVNDLKKQKYVVEPGNEKILRCKATLNIDKLSSTFPFVSNFFGLDPLEAKDTLNLEFRHFSEFPLK